MVAGKNFQETLVVKTAQAASANPVDALSGKRPESGPVLRR